jgi:hypothetical protein
MSHDPEVGEPIDRTHRHAKDGRDRTSRLAFSSEAHRRIALLGIQLVGAAKPHAGSLRDASPARVRSRQIYASGTWPDPEVILQGLESFG